MGNPVMQTFPDAADAPRTPMRRLIPCRICRRFLIIREPFEPATKNQQKFNNNMDEDSLDALEDAVAGEKPFDEVYEVERTIEIVHNQGQYRMEILRRIIADKGEAYFSAL